MLNKVILVGRLTRDPDLRYTPNGGVAVTRFTLAVQRNYKNDHGDYDADFPRIVCWRGLAENCAKYLSKGSLIALVGRLETSTYENADGHTVWQTQVVADDVRFLSTGTKSFNDPFDEDGEPIEIPEKLPWGGVMDGGRD